MKRFGHFDDERKVFLLHDPVPFLWYEIIQYYYTISRRKFQWANQKKDAYISQQHFFFALLYFFARPTVTAGHCPHLSDRFFHWARGAGSREQPKERRGKFAMLTFPLSPLGFSLELPFPHSLSPLIPHRFRWPHNFGWSNFAEAANSSVDCDCWVSDENATGGKWRPALPARHWKIFLKTNWQIIIHLL